jgi:hypothetical protein
MLRQPPYDAAERLCVLRDSKLPQFPSLATSEPFERSSSAVKARPATGATPSVEKRTFDTIR